MKRLSTIILICFTICILSLRALAVDEDTDSFDTMQRETYGIGALEEAVPDEAEKAFDGLTIEKAMHPQTLLERFWSFMTGSSELVFRSAIQNAGAVFLLCFTISILSSFPMEAGQTKIIGLIGAIALALFCLQESDACVPLGFRTVTSLSDFSVKLLPALCAAATAGGAITSAGVKYSISTLVLDLLITAALQIIQPMLKIYIALCISGIITQNEILQSINRLMKSALRICLIGTAILFTAYLSITGLLNESIDAASVKAAKTAIAGALPVVGGILSDAAASVISGAGILRAGTGILGIAAVIAVCWIPYLSLGVHFLLYRLMSGFASAFADKRISALLQGFSDIYGMILGTAGTVSLVLFVSIASLMKGVDI